jgi:Protein of unknown function (DUF1552)
MMITRTHLPRRTFLRGMSAALALPLLDSMTPAFAFMQAARPVRLGFLYTANGIVGCSTKSPRPNVWTPTTVGENFAMSPTLKPLEPHREYLNVYSGLAQVQGRALGDGPGDHARAQASFLTGVHPFKTGGQDFKLGISADQIAAKELGKYTQLSSLELCLEPKELAGNCDSGYTCAYMTMSWAGERNPLPAETVPRMVFERMFGDSTSTDPNARAERLRNQKSVIDYVKSSLSRLQRELGRSDNAKLDEYLTSVRDIERRVSLAETQSNELPVMERPSSIPADYRDYAKLMIDLMVVAWQTDMTRVASLMLNRDFSNHAYPEIGIPDAHHSLSHHQGDDDRLLKLQRIDEMHVSLVAYLAERLEQTPDGEGSLLDNSVTLFGSGISESNIHTHDDLPIVTLGKAGGRLKGNRHLVYPFETPLNNLLLNMLDYSGIPDVAGFGDSTGRLTGL